MSLFPPAELDEIIDKALASGLQLRREVLLSALGDRFAGTLETSDVPNVQLILDLRALNAVTRSIDDMMPLQAWLLTAAQILEPLPVADFFRERAAVIVPEPEPSLEEAKQRAEQTLSKLRQIAGQDQELRAAIQAASSGIDAISERWEPLVAFNRLHGYLRELQNSTLPRLQEELRQGRLDDDVSRIKVASLAGRIGMLVKLGRIELDHLVVGQEKTEQTEYLDELKRIKLELAEAVADQSTEQARDSATALGTLLYDWMSNLGLRLSQEADELNIEGLIEHLRSFAKQSLKIDDPRAANLRETATQLASLQDEITPTTIFAHERILALTQLLVDNGFDDVDDVALLLLGLPPEMLATLPQPSDAFGRLAGSLDALNRMTFAVGEHVPIYYVLINAANRLRWNPDFRKAIEPFLNDAKAAL